MKIDCSKKVLNLKGEQYKTQDGTPLYLGDVLAEALASDQTAGKMKIYSLALSASKNKEMEVDIADLALIKRAVNDCKSYNNIILGQALEALENVK